MRGCNVDMSAKLRPITPLDLSKYKRPEIPKNRRVSWRVSWYVINVIFFQSALFGLLPSKMKAILLRFFGAEVGRGFVCKPRVSIKYPWFLRIGDHVWLGEKVWIDNTCEVAIGSNVCISQGVYVCTGNHDWNDKNFAYFGNSVEIGDGVWITAFQFIRPGTNIPSYHAYLDA